ncbi:DUF4936 family protein [Thauera linaloolentis]|uniref:DUF4936 domain-containing protein n=1 Tax=Thauera linaloolentis (strain DSM 12138 / JCM 21573 / CCUG 41526 / CIP 105981 / IAM 15112 / NBRC 102519 / 47Lol) TaxID=1123367 RepID=N6Z579_THAL4|nr:DUF4936 family protein [Thauera linaloolentis]ENO89578.1 hypothetical protein C666_05315 [Thauera linaloolentis 47Lol = DSM 12138]MCM8565896.1 DUF4936 family protein [Thauera linaloolentis]
MNTATSGPGLSCSSAPAAAVHLYLYYRLRPDADAAAARTRVRAMQAELAQRTGIRGRLMRRADDAATWMEVYEDIADPEVFRRALEAATLAHRLADLLAADGMRHVECFTENP